MILKHRDFFQFLYFICLVILVKIPGTSAANVRGFNYCSTDTNGTRWRLVHSYEFENDTDIEEMWKIQNESGYEYCEDNHINKISCNNINSVKVDSGYMVVSIRQGKFDNFTFTSPALTSKSKINIGRLEMRIRLSRADFLYMSKIKKPPPTEEAQIGLGIYSLKHLTKIANFTYSYNNINGLLLYGLILVFFKVDLRHEENNKMHFQAVEKSGFHLIGVEWTTDHFQYFINDEFVGEPFLLDKSNSTIEPAYNFQVMVNDLEWACPAMITDYIRIYEYENSSSGYSSCKPLPVTKKVDEKEEQMIANRICSQSELGKEKDLNVAPSKTSISGFITLILVIGNLIVLCLVVYFIKRVRTLNSSRVQKTNDNLGIMNTKNEYLKHDELHVYEECKDSDNYYRTIHENDDQGVPDGKYDNKSAEYLDVQNAEKDNEYLKVWIPNSSTTNTC